MTVAAAILAGGEGSRFEGETHKLRADFRGRPVVSWVIDAVLDAGFNQVYLVTGAVNLDDLIEDLSDRPITVLHNERWRAGQSSSLAVAIETARHDGHDSLTVGLGDQPLVPTSAWRSVGASSGQIVTATFDGFRRPPVRLDSSIWDLVPTEGDEGARSLMKEQPELVSEIPCMGNPVDIDTVEDLRQWS